MIKDLRKKRKKNGLFSLEELDIIAALLPQGLTNDYGYGYIYFNNKG